jgi:hypothetical protein
MNKQSIRSLSPFLAAAAVFAASLFYAGAVLPVNASRIAACGTGQYEAQLTGWTLNEMTPTGTARYSAKDKLLEIEVEKVKLKDGTVLEVLIGDDKIGKMEPLKDNSAKAVIVVEDDLDEKSRVRIFNDDVPILSANLSCDAAQDATSSPTADN